jgi:hypothetical protein
MTEALILLFTLLAFALELKPPASRGCPMNAVVVDNSRRPESKQNLRDRDRPMRIEVVGGGPFVTNCFVKIIKKVENSVWLH